MRKPSRQMSRLNHTILVVLGFLVQIREGMTVPALFLLLKNKGVTIRRVTVYELLQNLQCHEIVEKEPEHTGRPYRPTNVYRLTKKGEEVAKTYRAAVIANNPPLVTLEELK